MPAEGSHDHVEPLNAYNRQRADQHGRVPSFFDPQDGGVRAKIIGVMKFLAADALNSRRPSQDNKDSTALALNCALKHAGIERKDLLLINGEAWELRDDETFNAPRCVPYILDIVKLVENPRVVVMLGAPYGTSQGGPPTAIEILRRELPHFRVIGTFSPGPQSSNHEDLRDHMIATLDYARRLAIDPSLPDTRPDPRPLKRGRRTY